MLVAFACLLAFVINVNSAPELHSDTESRLCNINGLAEEISSYEPVVKNIIEYVVAGAYKGKTYRE